MSYKRLKKKVRKVSAKANSKEIGELLSKLKAYSYEYKNPDHGTGRRVGVMAQDLEKTRLGKKVVVETPEGKMIDMNKGLGLALAAQSELSKRVKQQYKGQRS